MTSSAIASSPDADVEYLGNPEIDDELEFCGLQHRQVGRFLPLENPPDIDAALPEHCTFVGAIAHQAAGDRVLAPFVDRRDCVPGRQRGELVTPFKEDPIDANYQPTNPPLNYGSESFFNAAPGAGS